jgi:FMNH2-dependent dimethyl sulfone monooxygenase
MVKRMNANIGVYIPMYGGWIRGAPLQEEVTFKNAQKTALLAEKIGLSSIWVPDHLLNPIKGYDAPSLEAWTTLTAIAAGTQHIELYHTTICQGVRYPAVLAKMCATLQDVANGRFRLSLGAGWFHREFLAYGLPWEEHDARIDRSREQIEIVTRLWTEPTVNYHGTYYTLTDGCLEPKPSSIPLWWGGESEPSRELAADHCDGWLMSSSTLTEGHEKITDMNERRAQRGKRSMQYACPGFLVIERTDEQAEQVIRYRTGNTKAFNRMMATGYIGSPETVAEKIRAREATGIDYIIFQCAPTIATLQRFYEDVLPLL